MAGEQHIIVVVRKVPGIHVNAKVKYGGILGQAGGR